MFRVPFSLLVATLAGCGSSGPPSVDVASDSLPTLQQRIDLLNRYVTFRRNYRSLEFRIHYKNNSRGVPAPSEWDIRLAAEVPADELDQWIPAGFIAVPVAEVDTAWLADVPNGDRAAGVLEWYANGPNRVVGVDRQRSVVAFRRREF